MYLVLSLHLKSPPLPLMHNYTLLIIVTCQQYVLFCFVFFLFRATPEACGGSQARDLIGATAASCSRSHSNAKSNRVYDLHHRSQQRRTLNSLSESRDLNLYPQGCQTDLFLLSCHRNSYQCVLISIWDSSIRLFFIFQVFLVTLAYLFF